MIHVSVLLCIVPSTMALLPHCPTVPLSQHAILPRPTVPFSLSHGPIVRVSSVPASKVPLSIVSQPYCPIAPSRIAQRPSVNCRIVYCLMWSSVLDGMSY